MHLVLADIVGLVFVALALVCCSVYAGKRWRDATRTKRWVAEASDLIYQAAGGNHVAQDMLLEWEKRGWGPCQDFVYDYLAWLRRNLGKATSDHVKAICARTEIRHEYETRLPQVQECYVAWQEAVESGTFKEKLHAGARLHTIAFSGLHPDNRVRIGKEVVDHQVIANELDELIKQEASELWLWADQHEDAYLEFRSLLLMVKAGKIINQDSLGSELKLPPLLKLPFPPDWNRRTAEYIVDPHFEDFDAHEMQPGEAHRRAVEVRFNKDWVEAAVLLAYANSFETARSEIGELLLVELQDRVQEQLFELRGSHRYND